MEKGNRLLLDRLAVAMEKKNIDNDNDCHFHSLMAENQRKALRKVQIENDRLLHKIRTTDPVYKSVEWEREEHKREHYRRNLTNYPELYVSNLKSSKQLQRAQKYCADKMASSQRLPAIASPDGEPTQNGLTRPLSSTNISFIKAVSR